MEIPDTVVEGHQGFTEGSEEYMVFEKVLLARAAHHGLYPVSAAERWERLGQGHGRQWRAGQRHGRQGPAGGGLPSRGHGKAGLMLLLLGAGAAQPLNCHTALCGNTPAAYPCSAQASVGQGSTVSQHVPSLLGSQYPDFCSSTSGRPAHVLICWLGILLCVEQHVYLLHCASTGGGLRGPSCGQAVC
jgi:hypothetical protein